MKNLRKVEVVMVVEVKGVMVKGVAVMVKGVEGVELVVVVKVLAVMAVMVSQSRSDQAAPLVASPWQDK